MENLIWLGAGIIIGSFGATLGLALAAIASRSDDRAEAMRQHPADG